MTTHTKTLEEGTIAYDVAQREPVIITDPDVGTVESQSTALREMIENNAANRSIGFTDVTQCVEVIFFDMQSHNDTTYTYPETRIAVPSVEILDEKLTPKQFVQYQTLRDLLAEAIREDDLADDVDFAYELAQLWTYAGLDTDVLDAATDEVDLSGVDA